MTYRVGVDIGGSFTDFAVLDERDGTIRTLKVLSRPDAPGSEITTGLRALKDRYGILAEEISYFTHGTTVGVNTVIQRNGVKLALLTTRNFEDVLEIARMKIADVYNLTARRPAPLISRDMVFGVDERVDRDGNILRPVDGESVIAAVRAAQAAGARGIVISFLHSYRNPANEAEARRIIAEVAPEMLTSSSSEIWPIIREFERTITATINAYVQPKVIDYLDHFTIALENEGIPAVPRITKSNGGVMGLQQAKSECVQMILSGTASGVIGAGYIARSCDFPRILSLDIGGTSADVAVLRDGEAEYGWGETIGEFQIFIPSVSVSSIGQGGGSIAWIDQLGVLRVGPESAGSLPGPACYRRGGTEPTVTDAFAITGMIGHGDLGYKAVKVDVDASRQAVGRLAEKLGVGIEECADAIIRIAISSMYTECSGLVSRFGIDPREYYFLAFGGAGPMMGCLLAQAMNMKGVIVPPSPGVLSALGGLVADLKNDFIRTIYRDFDAGIATVLQAEGDSLIDEARTWLQVEHGPGLSHSLSFAADMRYRGQSFEVSVDLETDWVTDADPAAIRAAFDRTHERLFGHCDPSAPLQIINLRLVIASPTPQPALATLEQEEGVPPPVSVVQAYLDRTWMAVPFYLRKDLRAGLRMSGPAIITQDDTTTCMPSGMELVVDRYGNLIITPVQK